MFSADPFLPATVGVCKCCRHHTGWLHAQHGRGQVWQGHPGQSKGLYIVTATRQHLSRFDNDTWPGTNTAEESTTLHQGSFLVTQAVAQALVACGASKGSIITVGSIVGKVRFEVCNNNVNNLFTYKESYFIICVICIAVLFSLCFFDILNIRSKQQLMFVWIGLCVCLVCV